MSLGYASLLSPREDLGGQLGAPELEESNPEQLAEKIDTLAVLLQGAKRVVAFTGAGISTSCGIPDFRGPGGVWTLAKQGAPPPTLDTPFEHARPSLTHLALVALAAAGKLSLVVSQNVDGLHLRSGLPRALLAELHGCCFAERCENKACGAEHVRDFQMATVGFQRTGRACSLCGSKLRDQILDWEDALPAAELKAAESAAKEADVALTLGTSLCITPACNIPLRTVRAGGTLVIINLQKTPKDSKAGLRIHARCDAVMAGVLSRLNMPVPAYERTDRLAVLHAGLPGGKLLLKLASVHGEACPVPCIAGGSVTFYGRRAAVAADEEEAKAADDVGAALSGCRDAPLGSPLALPEPAAGTKWPLSVKYTPLKCKGATLSVLTRAVLRLRFMPQCHRPGATITYSLGDAASGRRTFSAAMYRLNYVLAANGTGAAVAQLEALGGEADELAPLADAAAESAVVGSVGGGPPGGAGGAGGSGPRKRKAKAEGPADN